MRRRDRPIVIVIHRKAAALGAVLALLAIASVVVSEGVSLVTSYPSPVGVYNQIVTTGGAGLKTVLNRDGGDTVLVPGVNSGSVGVGTGSPSRKLDVRGDFRATGAAEFGAGLDVGGAVSAGDVTIGGQSVVTDVQCSGAFSCSRSGNTLNISLCVASTCSAPAPPCGQVSNGVDNCGSPCTRTAPACAVYTLSVGQNSPTYCRGGDVRISCVPACSGRNNGVTMLPPNGCNAWEGPGNYGSACGVLTCQER